MFLKKVLNQPNLVGTVMIALLVCSGFVYAFAFDGFNVETATGGEVEAWLAQAGGGGSGGGSGDNPPTCTRVTKNDNKKKCTLSNGNKCTHNCLKKKRCDYKGC